MRGFLFLTVLALPLAACQSPNIDPVAQNAADDQYCQSLGFFPRTVQYDRCRRHRVGVALRESDERRRFLGY
jgi:hypothetical protein